ncbi:MAG: site-specific integrase [Reichenbachiella sp.]
MSTNHTFSALSIIRSSRSKNDLLPIYLRITVNGKRAEISTKEYVQKNKWNKDKGRMIGQSEAARNLNHRLDTWEHKAKEAYNQLLRDDKRISAQVIKNKVLGITEGSNDLLPFFDAQEKEVQSKIGIDYSTGTHKNYVATGKHLKSFLEKKFKSRVITLKDLNYDFIDKFETYLKLEIGNSNNGAIKHIQRLKKVVHVAMKRGLLTANPFAAYSVKIEKVNREFLTEDELQIISTQDLTSPTLHKVRDLFIFICYTGLSYSDLADLKEDNLIKGIDGGLWLVIERNKTSVVTRIPLLEPALEILDKYKNRPDAQNQEKLLPVMSNQKMNKYLKEIATICKIHKPVTCHIGRHTFATTITLSNSIPIETVSQMLGHTSLRTTQIYAKVVQEKISNDMGKLKDILAQKKDKAANQ